MKRRILGRLTYANVMATVAVFISLGGGAYAANPAAEGQRRDPRAQGWRGDQSQALQGRAPRPPRRKGCERSDRTGWTRPDLRVRRAPAGPNDLVSGSATSADQSYASCDNPTPLNHTLTVPVASVLYATGVTTFSDSDASYHSIGSGLALLDGSGSAVAFTPKVTAATGIANTPVELDAAGLLLDLRQQSSGTPYVLQPGVTYTLSFSPQMGGACTGFASLPSMALSWIALPQSS